MVEPPQQRRSSRLGAAAAAASRGPAPPSPTRRKQTANPAARCRAPPPPLSSSFPRTRLLLTLLAAQLLLALTPGLYHSTDFEVHRNWLAITSSLPLSQWYRDATNPNATLDYPPLFAWFEWALARVARLGAAAMGAVGKQGSGSRTWADAMLKVQREPHALPECVLFQRLTVVATGLALTAVTWWASLSEPSASGKKQTKPNPLLFFLITCNAGLLMVDYVHFQYNGWLMALLLLSILLVERGGEWQLMAQRQQRGVRQQTPVASAASAARTHYLLASVAFAALLASKHLFAYAGPAFFVYLLRAYVLEGVGVAVGDKKSDGVRRPATTTTTTTTTILARLALLASAVLAVFALSFGPFVANGTFPDILSRLFPFGRGLLHAYWAPNAWALYAAADKALAAVVGRLGRRHSRLPVVANMSGGLVGVAEFAVLPQVGPRAAAAATIVAMLPALVALWRRPTGGTRRFCAAVAHGLLCGFMFGYHVHEKAVITFLLPMALLAAAEEEEEEEDASAAAADDFLLASTAGHVGIFPLLFRPQELMLRWALAAFYFVVAAWGLAGRGGAGGAGAAVTGARQQASLTLTTRLFACGCVALELFNVLVAPKLLPNLPFLPLMITSVWCACAISLVWARWTARWLREATIQTPSRR